MNFKRFIGIALIALVTLSACTPKEVKNDDASLIQVVATIGMIADAAQIIGGDKVAVTALMGPGVDPHLYKASAGDVSRLTRADLILFNGLHLETKMGEVLEKMDANTKTKAVSETIDTERLLAAEDYDTAYDPHVWFDVSLWRQSVVAIRDSLIDADADHADYFSSRWEAYDVQLQDLQAYVIERLSVVEKGQRVLVTAHDAFNYFGKAYEFQVRGLQGISTVSEAGTKDVQNLAQYIADNRIAAIFIESSVPKRNVEALQAAVKSRGFAVEIGGELFSDAMGDPGTAEGTYLGMVRHNIDTIANALGK
ncbi:MAG: zinc ABC transporter substrate-binding protein [Spirochaetia bacterium]|jgi:manganese/zinc/iron transport system substrate-binding protein|nr:zinc ABC transporter substrate-binding protein [Spirochaetia bacterium]